MNSENITHQRREEKQTPCELVLSKCHPTDTKHVAERCPATSHSNYKRMWWSLEADGGYITSHLLKTRLCVCVCVFLSSRALKGQELAAKLLPFRNVVRFIQKLPWTLLHDSRNIWHVANNFSTSATPVLNAALILTLIQFLNVLVFLEVTSGC